MFYLVKGNDHLYQYLNGEVVRFVCNSDKETTYIIATDQIVRAIPNKNLIPLGEELPTMWQHLCNDIPKEVLYE